MALEFRHAANDNESPEHRKVRERREFIAQSSGILDATLSRIKEEEPNAKKWEDAQREVFFTVKKSYAEANRAIIALEEEPNNDEAFQNAKHVMANFFITLTEYEPLLPESFGGMFDNMPS